MDLLAKLEGIAERAVNRVALRRQFERAVEADEQLPPNLLFQQLHLLGDGPRRDVEFICRARQAEVARGGLERGQRIE